MLLDVAQQQGAKDANTLKTTLLKDIERDEGIALFNKGLAVYNNKNYNEALVLYRSAASKGIAEANLNLAVMYAHGEGIEKNIKEAMRFIDLAEKQGAKDAVSFRESLLKSHTDYKNADDFNNANKLYNDKQVTQAFDEYKRLAEQNFTPAMSRLALLYHYGDGVAKDDALAFMWAQKAVNLGDVDAQYQLGTFYIQGIGVPKNDQQALLWFSKAAEKGHQEAIRDQKTVQYRLTQSTQLKKTASQCINTPAVAKIGPFQTYAGDCFISYRVPPSVMRTFANDVTESNWSSTVFGEQNMAAAIMSKMRGLFQSKDSVSSTVNIELGVASVIMDTVRAYFRDDFDHIIFIWDFEAIPPKLENRTGHNTLPDFKSRCADIDCPRFLSPITLTYWGDQFRGVTLLHEIFHQYANEGVPTVFASHWGISSAGGVLGGFDSKTLSQREDKSYKAISPVRYSPRATSGQINAQPMDYFDLQGNPSSVPYSPLELYMMGLLPASEVPDLLVAKNSVCLDGQKTICKRFSTEGFEHYTAQKIGELMGKQKPDMAKARKSYRGLVVVLTDKEQLSADHIQSLTDDIEQFSRPSDPDIAWADQQLPFQVFNFWQATQGKASYSLNKISQFVGDNPEVQTKLGVRYRTGNGVAQDFEQAKYWLNKAFNLHYPAASYEFGEMYYYGQGVKKDIIKASNYFNNAAALGYVEAQYRVGLLYIDGNSDIDKNYNKAAEWLNKAALQGHINAQASLTTLLANNGDYEKSYFWLNVLISRIKNLSKAEDMLKSLEKLGSNVGGKLTEVQREEIKQDAMRMVQRLPIIE